MNLYCSWRSTKVEPRCGGLSVAAEHWESQQWRFTFAEWNQQLQLANLMPAKHHSQIMTCSHRYHVIIFFIWIMIIFPIDLERHLIDTQSWQPAKHVNKDHNRSMYINLDTCVTIGGVDPERTDWLSANQTQRLPKHFDKNKKNASVCVFWVWLCSWVWKMWWFIPLSQQTNSVWLMCITNLTFTTLCSIIHVEGVTCRNQIFNSQRQFPCQDAPHLVTLVKICTHANCFWQVWVIRFAVDATGLASLLKVFEVTNITYVTISLQLCDIISSTNFVVCFTACAIQLPFGCLHATYKLTIFQCLCMLKLLHKKEYFVLKHQKTPELLKSTFSCFQRNDPFWEKWTNNRNMLYKGSYIVDTDTVLGNGSFGIVHPAKHQQKSQNVAAKRIERKSETDAHEVATDLLKLVDLDHPNIARVFDIAQDRKSVWMFLEYCEHKNLQKYFDTAKVEGRKVSDSDKVKLMLDIAKGVDYLHKINVIHRDVKPSNILLAGDPVSAKLTDFDFSKFLGAGQSTMTTKVGTEAFKAPEFFFRTDDGKLKYKRSVDIFAAGLTFLAMIQENEGLLPKVETPNEPPELYLSSGRLLFERITYKIQPQSVVDVSRGNRLEREIRSLVMKMTSAEPTDRLHADQVVETLLDIHNAEAKKAAALKVQHKNLVVILCYARYFWGTFPFSKLLCCLSFLQIYPLFELFFCFSWWSYKSNLHGILSPSLTLRSCVRCPVK